MKHQWIIHKKQPHLVLFFCGWGSDPRLLSDCCPEGADLLVCYDYQDLRCDMSLLRPYQSIRLVAWSLGVWVATTLFNGTDWPWEKKIAINGTPFPIDDHLGIPEQIFTGTLEQFSERNLQKFRRRMCGSRSQLALFEERLPERDSENIRSELAQLYQAIQKQSDTLTPQEMQPAQEMRPAAAGFWDKAYISREDMIFPADHQEAAWQICHCPYVLQDGAHFEPALWLPWVHGKEVTWTKN